MSGTGKSGTVEPRRLPRSKPAPPVPITLPSDKPGTLGHLIRERRIALGLSQYDLAELTDIPQNTISRLERGVIRLPNNNDVLLRLGDALDIPPARLLSLGKYPNDAVPVLGSELSRQLAGMSAKNLKKLQLMAEFLNQNGEFMTWDDLLDSLITYVNYDQESADAELRVLTSQ